MSLSEIILYTTTGIALLLIIFISISFIAYKVKNRNKTKPNMPNSAATNSNFRKTSEVLNSEVRIDNHMISYNYFVEDRERIVNPNKYLPHHESKRMFK
ncbi:MAG: hypothetical protein ACYDA4_12120 [Ignavibacteriaceae bacterium]